MGERHNIVLTGFMGTGKSTVGRVLAEQLGYRLVDTDELIEERYGPIPQIFVEYGEPEFRRIEREVAAELAECDGLVISTGGRMMVDPVNADALAATGDVYCLTASVDTLVERLGADGPERRPMLAGFELRARISDLLAERAPAYARFAQVATDALDPNAVAAAILAASRSR